MAKRLRPLRTGPPWAKDAALKFLDYLEELIKGALSSNELHITSVDRKYLEGAQNTLRPAVDLLVERFFEPIRSTEPWVSDAGYMALLEVLQGAYFTGSRVIISDSIKKFIQESHAKAARGGKVPRDAARIVTRRAAVREAMKATSAKRSRSLEYAGLIRPDVLKRLGLPEDSTSHSVSTIRSDVRAILKETTGESDKA
jgi:hypothetical protein